MSKELLSGSESSALESQLATFSNIQTNDFAPEVRNYLKNLITQAQEILTTYNGKLDTTPIRTLKKLKSLITKLKHVAKTKEIPPEDDNYHFKIENAINPYEEVLVENGLPAEHEFTLELNLKEVLESDRQAYQQSNLPEWAEALPKTFTIPPESRKLIEEQLKQGAIPIFMPSAQVQQETLLKALKSLKPTWIQDGKILDILDTHIWDYLEGLITAKDPTLISGVPDKSYVLLVKPTQQPPKETTSLTVEQQKKKLAELQQEEPYLESILPQEYVSLQMTHDKRIEEENWAWSNTVKTRSRSRLKLNNRCVSTLGPLDRDTVTRFITLTPTGGHVPYGCWNNSLKQLEFFQALSDWVDPSYGFRTVVRVPVVVSG